MTKRFGTKFGSNHKFNLKHRRSAEILDYNFQSDRSIIHLNGKTPSCTTVSHYSHYTFCNEPFNLYRSMLRPKHFSSGPLIGSNFEQFSVRKAIKAKILINMP